MKEEHPADATATPAESPGSRDAARVRILAAAIELLSTGGRDAVTTRAVADAAGVQAPTLYRLFGDKDGLLRAVAEHGFAAYLAKKEVRRTDEDPVEELRRGWDLHVAFGLANPALYLLMYADPRPGAKTPAAATAYRILRQHIHHAAAAGRLRVSEEWAAGLFHASASGTILLLLGMAEGERDMELSTLARESALATITTTAFLVERPGPAATAVTLRSLLPQATGLSQGERVLLEEWLDRLAVSRE